MREALWSGRRAHCNPAAAAAAAAAAAVAATAVATASGALAAAAAEPIKESGGEGRCRANY